MAHGIQQCNFCGTQLYPQNVITCPSCSAQLAYGAQQCYTCGAQLHQPSRYVPPPPVSSFSAIPIIIAIAVVIVVILAVVALSIDNSGGGGTTTGTGFIYVVIHSSFDGFTKSYNLKVDGDTLARATIESGATFTVGESVTFAGTWHRFSVTIDATAVGSAWQTSDSTSVDIYNGDTATVHVYI